MKTCDENKLSSLKPHPQKTNKNGFPIIQKIYCMQSKTVNVTSMLLVFLKRMWEHVNTTIKKITQQNLVK